MVCEWDWSGSGQRIEKELESGGGLAGRMGQSQCHDHLSNFKIAHVSSLRR